VTRGTSERFSRFRRDGAVVAQKLHGRRARQHGCWSSAADALTEGELCTIKALQRAGQTGVPLEDEREPPSHYELAGVDDPLVERVPTSSDCRASQRGSGRCSQLRDLRTHAYRGVRVGMIALCTTLGGSGWESSICGRPASPALARSLAASMSAVEEARGILRMVRPGWCSRTRSIPRKESSSRRVSRTARRDCA
jgi:hypothetical protein